LSDPRDDRARIENSKDKLIPDSQKWILHHPAFQTWWETSDTRLLWINGDAGKGKTMIMMGLIDEVGNRLAEKSTSIGFSYFFCQSTNMQLNNAVSVIRGLIYLLIDQHRHLIKHLKQRYETAGPSLFEGPNTFYTLQNVLFDILKDLTLKECYFLVDALDECDGDLNSLLDLISATISKFPNVKWLVASRKHDNIKEQLGHNDIYCAIDLGENRIRVKEAVMKFIDIKVNELATKKSYPPEVKTKVKHYLESNADETFLWIHLVCKELQRVRARRAETTLLEFPPGLDSVYQCMINQIQRHDMEDIQFCFRVLSAVLLAYRPLHLEELATVATIPENDAEELVGLCGSFLSIQDKTVYFVHQSAKDFLHLGEGLKIILPQGIEDGHRQMVERCMDILSRQLKKDICDLKYPGFLNRDLAPKHKSRILYLRYACCYWVRHMQHIRQGSISYTHILSFFSKHLLHWIEALGLIGEISDGILQLKLLQDKVKVETYS